MRALHARRSADGWCPGSAAGLRSRTYAELVRARARNHHALRSDHAHSHARLSIHRTRTLSSWRLVTLGGAPVPPELVRRAREQDVKVAIGFGQTEASPYLTHTLPDDPHPDWISTVGRPMPQTEIKIVSTETGAIVPVGEIGEICAR